MVHSCVVLGKERTVTPHQAAQPSSPDADYLNTDMRQTYRCI